MCVGLDGKVVWQSPVTPSDPGAARTFGLGGFLLADGTLFVVDGRSGMLRLIEASTTEDKELASAPILSGEDVRGPRRAPRRRGDRPRGIVERHSQPPSLLSVYSRRRRLLYPRLARPRRCAHRHRGTARRQAVDWIEKVSDEEYAAAARLLEEAQ